MPNPQIEDQLIQLRRACMELAHGFEMARNLSRSEQVEAMREASAALIELRRTTDQLFTRLR